MSAQNPVFAHPGRAAYELPKLLKSLGNIECSVPLTAAQHNTVDAITSHAWGAVEVITDGMESIGALMSIVGHGESFVDGRRLAALGSLLEHLAVELQQLHQVETDMAEIMRSDAAKLVPATPTAAGKQRS